MWISFLHKQKTGKSDRLGWMGKHAGTKRSIVEEKRKSNEHDYTAMVSGPVDGWVSELRKPVGSLKSRFGDWELAESGW